LKNKIPQLIENLPSGMYVIGDIAYVCYEHLLTPYSGPQKHQEKKDAYNFVLSKLCIQIEMAFGMLTNKWRILKQPLQVKLKNVGKLFLCITRLHNYCIYEISDETFNCHISVFDDAEDSFEPSQFIKLNETIVHAGELSILRALIVDKIASKGLSRPDCNIQRNRN
jgi:DDE superfamily endonuclease